MRSLEKFQRSRRPALAALTAGLLFGAAPVQAAEVVALGDTWSSGAASALQTSLGAASLGYTVADWGSPAGTAEFYATTGTATITAALAANPDVQWVWLSVGFDDLVNRYPAESGNQIAAANDANLRTILNSIFAAAPQVRVVMFAYDYPNYVQTPACQTQLATDFGVTATQLDVNSLMITSIGASMQAVADGYAQATYVPLFGTLQVAAGGSADSTLPSPATHMADCTHPNATGYAALMDALVTAYWQAALPTSVASASATTICSGDIVTFTSLSTQNQGQVWRLQGTVTSTLPTWMAAISGTGTATVTLEAYNFAWTDTSTVNLTLNNCTDAGVPDTGALDSGAMDAGMVDSGVVDAAPDAAIDAGFPDAAPDAAVDAGFPDAAPDAAVDAGFPDAAPDAAVDAGFPDAAPDAAIDAGFPDAAPDAAVDAGFPDAAIDAGFPDAAPDAAIDAGFPDAAPDAAIDAGFPDAAPDAAIDAGFPDAAPDAEVDAGFPDAEVDAGFPDAEVDAGFPDAEVDAGFPDAEVDAGFPDAEVDAGFPDAEVDAGFPDAEVDAGFPDAEVDSGVIEPDTGVAEPDTGVIAPDTGVIAPDAGTPDSGAVTADAGANVFDDINITGNGCSCETDRAASTERGLNPWALAGLFALVLLRRRRR